MGSISDTEQHSGLVQLPIINIRNASPETGKEMVDAAIKYGFLYISTEGTDFTEEFVNRMFSLSKSFFTSPIEEKEACQIGTDNRGWAAMNNENLDPANQRKGDFKETFNFGEFVQGQPRQDLPKVFQSNLNDLVEFEKICQKTCSKILDLIGTGLEVEEPGFFSGKHAGPGRPTSSSIIRMLRYPAVQEGSDVDSSIDIRAGAHSDYGSITLLFQRPSQPGLEIRTPEDTWAPVPVIPEGYHSTTFPPILVNIGDAMSYWTNGLLKSTIHRVIFPKDHSGEDRYSIAYFCQPLDDTELTAVPSEAVRNSKLDDHAQIGYGGGATNERALTAKEHLMNRLRVTYGHRVERET